MLLNKKYSVALEQTGVDIVASKDTLQYAIEIETGNSYPTKNILKCIQQGYTKIISIATNKQVYAEIKRFITYYKLQEKVTLVLASTIHEGNLF